MELINSVSKTGEDTCFYSYFTKVKNQTSSCGNSNCIQGYCKHTSRVNSQWANWSIAAAKVCSTKRPSRPAVRRVADNLGLSEILNVPRSAPAEKESKSPDVRTIVEQLLLATADKK